MSSMLCRTCCDWDYVTYKENKVCSWQAKVGPMYSVLSRLFSAFKGVENSSKGLWLSNTGHFTCSGTIYKLDDDYLFAWIQRSLPFVLDQTYACRLSIASWLGRQLRVSSLEWLVLTLQRLLLLCWILRWYNFMSHLARCTGHSPREKGSMTSSRFTDTCALAISVVTCTEQILHDDWDTSTWGALHHTLYNKTRCRKAFLNISSRMHSLALRLDPVNTHDLNAIINV